MASWNKNKPAWLSEEDKKRCIATPRGWVLKRENGMEELLVAIRGLEAEPVVEGKVEEAKNNKKSKNKLKEGIDESIPTIVEEPIVEEAKEEPVVEE